MAPRSCITQSQNDGSRQFVFDVQCELLHAALLKVEILRLNSTRELRGIGLCRNHWQERGAQPASRIASKTAGRSTQVKEWREAAEVVDFCIIRRILPKPLRALVP